MQVLIYIRQLIPTILAAAPQQPVPLLQYSQSFPQPAHTAAVASPQHLRFTTPPFNPTRRPRRSTPQQLPSRKSQPTSRSHPIRPLAHHLHPRHPALAPTLTPPSLSVAICAWIGRLLQSLIRRSWAPQPRPEPRANRPRRRPASLLEQSRRRPLRGRLRVPSLWHRPVKWLGAAWSRHGSATMARLMLAIGAKLTAMWAVGET